MTCRTKYIVVDEIQGLTPQAVEALLKSIEEPPPCVRYILCTTNVNEIPLTIHSRCIVLHFSKVSWLEMANNLMVIAKKENVKLDDNRAKLIAKKSDGSVRTSLNNLEKTISYSNIVTNESVSKSLDTFDDSSFYNLFKCLSEKNLQNSFVEISSILNVCSNTNEIVNGLVDYLRKLMIINVSKECPSEITQDDFKKIELQANLFKINTICKMIENVINIKKGMLVNIDFQTLLENWVIQAIILVTKQNSD